MLKIMLSLDLTNAKDNRAEFYNYLEEAGWKKAKNVDTVWLKETKDYNPQDSNSLINVEKEEIVNPLAKAHKELKLDKIYYVAQFGNAAFVSRVIEIRNGVLKAYIENLY
ncbi:hypothetical protein [Pseudomonas viridiflava]|uniref:hypothetical protein n=1 Tax=Pseudomonas viridiflava TaxID=33069 RepID=UPI001BCB3335|nr:hypothetical protein [Pseudomonas viridiflava]QVI88028.1 hypothetical protein KHW14_12045 [Pseudomonas viridiflava]